MRIGIDASRAFQKNRTGIEEYSYRVIERLMDKLEGHEVVLYIKKNQKSRIKNQEFLLPNNWKIKEIKFPYLWTQLGLSLEMLFHPVDALFIPAHTVPLIHPASRRRVFASRGGSRNTIVTIHGLEYEFCPKAYSFWARLYMRWSIKMSCKWAKTIIAVSENTKKDLMKLYKVPEEKIKVIYEGYNRNFQFPIPSTRDNFQTNFNDQISKPCILFVGRLEERKNISGIVEAYKILKEKYNIPHSLVLAGKPGHNYGIIKVKIENSLKIKNLKLKIIEPGYINEAQKWQLLSGAEIFLFPTLYEGFGIPILEAQSVGCPVVAGNNSSIQEVVGCHPERIRQVAEESKDLIRSLDYARDDKCSAILVNPSSPEQIADAAYKLISDKALRDDIIKKGYENVKRFSWDKCADQIATLLNG